MCGRLSQTTAAEKAVKIMQIFGNPPEFLGSRYNVAPSQYVYAIQQPKHGENHWRIFQWGLVPFWAKDKKIGSRMFNARAETLEEKPSFRAAFRYRRCIIPADDFFEWKTVEGQKRKQPYEIRRKDKQPLFFAGLWESWEQGGEIIDSCTIITTDANEMMKPLHDRMPVIIPYDQANRWLDPDIQLGKQVRDLLKPAPEGELEAEAIDSERLKKVKA
jgi:putative SOS response-associated peptidase YedK